MNLDDVLSRLTGLPEVDRAGVVQSALAATKDMAWVPNPGAQTEAYFCEADELFYGGSAGGGKALALDTPIATPVGWARMGDLREGDEVMGADGTPARIVAVTPPMIGRACFRIRFSDGEEIVADEGHQWLTMTEAERVASTRRLPEVRARRRTTRAKRGTGKRPDLALRNAAAARGLPPPIGSVRTTAEIAATLLSARGALNHSVELAEPLVLPSSDLPIEPYLLGAWLGDGTSSGARITIAEPEMIGHVETAASAHGWSVTDGADRYDYGIVGGMRVVLRQQGLLRFKHIPPEYLRASVPQRLALLQGLMDTDGYADQRGQCEFTSCSEVLARGVHELIVSLGCKASIAVGMATLNGRDIAPKYRIKFLSPFPAFRLARKLARQKMGGFRQTTTRRFIEEVEPVPSVPVRCIQVDSPSRLFLAGRNMVPTHNSDLIVGLSLTEHQRSLVLRRTNKEASKLFDRYRDILGHRNGWNGQDNVWRLPDGKVVDIGGCQLEDDKQKYKGTPHDLIGFDEVSDFTETQYTFITIWNRSADPEQRCRVVAAGNPPTRPEGYWVLRYWGPWLDPTHPNPAKPGEIRWFLGGEEVDGPGPHNVDGTWVKARSRTFIPARLEDNPDLAATNYDSVLAGLPEALRLAYREGRFDIEAADDHWQAIPTQWVRDAQTRWTERPPVGIPMCAIGVDVAQGGTDNTVLAIRHDGWFAPLLSVPGSQTPGGTDVAGLVVAKRRDDARVIVDIGGGWGGDAYAHLKANGVDVVSYMGVKPSVRRTKDNQLKFANIRTQAYWQFREALNPDQPGGSPIMLPDDRELLADLTAPTYQPVPGGIALEAKDKLVKRLGRSPDKGDAVVMAWFSGAKALTDAQNWKEQARRPLGRVPQVIFGHQAKRR